jgi:hypothetical protein
VLLKKGHCSFLWLRFWSNFKSKTIYGLNMINNHYFYLTVKIKSKPKEAKKEQKVSQKKPKRSHILYKYLLSFT